MTRSTINFYYHICGSSDLHHEILNSVFWARADERAHCLERHRMVRKLKYHEKKLLKKVDFISWQSDNNIQEVKALRKYHIQKREDYAKWVLSNL